MNRKRNRSGMKVTQRGIALPMTCVLIFTFLAFLGLVLDGGLLVFKKRWMQGAADAAAVGGAREVLRSKFGPSRPVVDTGREDSARNGFTHGEENVTVTINNPPASGPNQDANHVEAIVEQDVSTYFMRALDVNVATVRARGVAGLAANGNGDVCVQALDPDGRPGFRVSGVGTVNAQCGVMVNSCDERNAIAVEGDKAVLNATMIGVCGGPKRNAGSATCTHALPEDCPTIDTPPIPDIYGYRDQPADDFIASYSPVFSDILVEDGDEVWLDPGRYNGSPAITVEGGTLHLRRGFYIIEGMSVLAGTVNAIDVTLFNTGNELIKINGGTVTVHAPAASDLNSNFDYVALWCDRNSPDINPGHIFHGNGSSSWRGIVYCSTQHVDWAGNNQSGDWVSLVAHTVHVAGVSDMFSTNLAPPPPGVIPELTTVNLVE